MSGFSDFPVTQLWPPTRPGAIQLYSYLSANSVKLIWAMAELGLDFEVHEPDLSRGETRQTEFLALNPAGKLPAIIDPDGPGGGAIGLFDSNAILIYLARKCGRLLPSDPAAEARALCWLMVQATELAPAMSRMGAAAMAARVGAEADVPGAAAALVEVHDVLEAALGDRDWFADEFSIADIAIASWLRGVHHTGSAEAVAWDRRKGLPAFLDRTRARLPTGIPW